MVKKSASKIPTSQRTLWLKILRQPAARKNLGVKPFRVLIDTNVWFSAIVFGGRPKQIIRYCLEHTVVVSSDHILDELLGVLDAQLRAPNIWRLRMVRAIRQRVVMMPPMEPNTLHEIRDVHDAPVVAAAIEGNCDIIISGDEDFLSLHNYSAIAILSVKDALELLTEIRKED